MSVAHPSLAWFFIATPCAGLGLGGPRLSICLHLPTSLMIKNNIKYNIKYSSVAATPRCSHPCKPTLARDSQQLFFKHMDLHGNQGPAGKLAKKAGTCHAFTIATQKLQPYAHFECRRPMHLLHRSLLQEGQFWSPWQRAQHEDTFELFSQKAQKAQKTHRPRSRKPQVPSRDFGAERATSASFLAGGNSALGPPCSAYGCLRAGEDMIPYAHVTASNHDAPTCED